MRKTTFVFFLLALLLMTSIATAQEAYTTTRSARVRSEPNTSAEIVTTLRAGTAITVLETVQGESVSGSRVWYRIRNGYVHSSLVRAGGSPASGDSSSGGNGAVGNGGNTSLATVEPVVPASSGASCGGATTCGQMNSCEQAYACLYAGNSRLDRDKDGVPCESICPGG